MPDSMKTPSNRRYMINFQQKEPVNKHDIWLSLNKHELDGNIVQDSEFLYDTDLVLKVFMNGKWRPIFGLPLNYEGIIDVMKKKINLVPKFEDGNLAVFRQGADECDQLVDGGSLIEILKELIEGGELIPITRATEFTLGGVKALTIRYKDINDTIVEAKFKGPKIEGNHENDRLGVLISEIYSNLMTYMMNKEFYLPIPLMSPIKRGGAKSNPRPHNPRITFPVYVDSNEVLQVDASSLTSIIEDVLHEIVENIDIYEAGEGIDITNHVISNIQATDTSTGGVKVDNWTQSAVIKNIGVEIYYGNNILLDSVTREIIDTEHLCITQEQLWALLNYTDEYTESMFRTGFGVQPIAHHDYNSHTEAYDDYYTFNLIHSSTDWGKYLKIKSDGSDIEWVDIPVGTVYPPLVANTVAGTECVVVAPVKKDGFLRGDGEFVDINSGNSVSITPILQSGTKIADFTIDNIGGSLYAPNSEYYNGIGITIDQTNHIGLNMTGAIADYVLGYNGTNVEWIPQLHYTDGYGIQITNTNIINGLVLANDTIYEAESHIAFNCVWQASDNPLSGIAMTIDYSPSLKILDPWSYTEVKITSKDVIVSLDFILSRQMLFMQGNPVYVLLEITSEPSQVTIDVHNEQRRDAVINVNNAIILDNNISCLNITNYKMFLCTLQFGILKVEPLESTVANDNQQEES